jgi:hypothetical protein
MAPALQSLYRVLHTLQPVVAAVAASESRRPPRPAGGHARMRGIGSERDTSSLSARRVGDGLHGKTQNRQHNPPVGRRPASPPGAAAAAQATGPGPATGWGIRDSPPRPDVLGNYCSELFRRSLARVLYAAGWE